MTTTLQGRHIPFQQCLNFRDMGGYRTTSGRSIRWRRLFRSGALHRMTLQDSALAHDALGITAVLDFRTRQEVAEQGKGPLFTRGVRHLHLPLLQVRTIQDRVKAVVNVPPGPDMTIEDTYCAMLKEGGAQLTIALNALADPGMYPAVVHCAAGKDRTGVVAAVILSIVGVEDQDIALDYALSNQYLAPASKADLYLTG